MTPIAIQDFLAQFGPAHGVRIHLAPDRWTIVVTATSIELHTLLFERRMVDSNDSVEARSVRELILPDNARAVLFLVRDENPVIIDTTLAQLSEEATEYLTPTS